MTSLDSISSDYSLIQNTNNQKRPPTLINLTAHWQGNALWRIVSKCTLGPTHVSLLPYIFNTCKVKGNYTKSFHNHRFLCVARRKKGEPFSRVYVSLFLLILWKLMLWVWNTWLRRVIKLLADLSPRASKHPEPKAPEPLQAPAQNLALSGIPAHSGARIASV